MTTARWVLLGLLLGFSMSTALSCGPATKACGPKECPFGCCDATGACQPGSSSAQCGAQGSACTACALAQQCNLGICGSFGTGGGFGGSGGGTTGGGTGGATGGGTGGGTTGGGTGGGTTGGGTGGGGGGALCGPGNCSGCCGSNGACVNSPNNANNTTCGSAGNACADCASVGATCNASSRTCQSGTGGGGGACDGCRVAGSTCVPLASTSVINCGRNGATCLACFSGQVCAQGVCFTTGGGGGSTGGGGGSTGGGGGSTGGGGGSTGGGGGATGGGGGGLGGGTGGAGGGFSGGESCASPVILPGQGTYNDSTLSFANDHDFLDTGLCVGSTNGGGGPDKVYRVTVPAGSTLMVEVTPEAGFDATLNLISGASNCGGSSGSGLVPVCLTGADDPESATWINTLGTSTQVLILVDGWTATESGAFTLAYSITP